MHEHVLHDVFGGVCREPRDEHTMDRAAKALVQLPERLPIAERGGTDESRNVTDQRPAPFADAIGRTQVGGGVLTSLH